MLRADATYRSSRVGAYQGRDAIIDMMRGFFSRFPDVRWRISEIRTGDGLEAVFGFVMTATHADTGEPVERRGTERIRFDAAGSITHVDVEA